jgi:hypothetical protein
MSPILDIQRRLHQDGRIRIGAQVPAKDKQGKDIMRPKALDKFRFTSQNHRAIEAIAKRYGGEVCKWEGAPVGEQWEVLTEASEIPVVVPPESMSYSVWYEQWSGGGCQRRCDGEQDTISDGPCVCDPENRECKPHTRLSVMLAQYPGTGLWRLDTSGYYAATELGGAMEIVGMLSATIGKSVLPGRLRIEHRTVKRPDQPPNNFIVPVLEFDVDMAALATGNVAAIGTGRPEIGETTILPCLTPVPMDDTPAPSLPDQLTAMDSTPAPAKRAGTTTIPATGIRPRTAKQAEAGERPSSPSRSAPRWGRDLHIRATGLDLDEARFDAVVMFVTNDRTSSTKELTAREAGLVNECLTEIEKGELGLQEGNDGGWLVRPTI